MDKQLTHDAAYWLTLRQQRIAKAAPPRDSRAALVDAYRAVRQAQAERIMTGAPTMTEEEIGELMELELERKFVC